MKATTDIEFLNNYWKEAKRIAEEIKTELPNCTGQLLKEVDPSNKTLMYIVKKSDLGNSWSVQDILKEKNGRSATLEVLADKIYNMILKGDAQNVKPMIEKIITGRIKSLSKGISKYEKNKNKQYKLEYNYLKYKNKFLGRGSFRWNRQAYILTPKEIERIKTYFKL